MLHSSIEVALPAHIAIVMDGNGRWAEARGETRAAGHRAGLEPVRGIIRECTRLGVQALTLFAFSSENWRRPEIEVAAIRGLFMEALDREVEELHANGVRLRVIAVSYGGRWDLGEAARRLAVRAASGALQPSAIDEATLAAELQLADVPDPDLFIRTGGDHRVSNFLLWNIAYAELFFTDVLWPQFDETVLAEAIADFTSRERRFGLTGRQRSTGAEAAS